MAVKEKEKMERTSATVPAWMKREMERTDVNWSAVVREAIRTRLDLEGGRNRVDAVLINERLRRRAPRDWDSTEVVRAWRRRG